MFKTIVAAALAAGITAVSGCTDNQAINATTGGLAGAAVGSQVGDGRGRTAATLAGAAIGTTLGANAPTTKTCTYRNPQTGATYQAAC
jgi:uncharacterized protein YcfJ